MFEFISKKVKLCYWVFVDIFSFVSKQVKLDAVVLEIVTSAFVSIVLFVANLLILTFAVYEVAAEHYHTLSDSDVDD